MAAVGEMQGSEVHYLVSGSIASYSSCDFVQIRDLALCLKAVGNELCGRTMLPMSEQAHHLVFLRLPYPWGAPASVYQIRPIKTPAIPPHSAMPLLRSLSFLVRSHHHLFHQDGAFALCIGIQKRWLFQDLWLRSRPSGLIRPPSSFARMMRMASTLSFT